MTANSIDLISFDNTQAFNEGWGVFDCDGSENGPWQLCKLDEADAFPSDDEAWSFVAEKVREGSAYHKAALAFLCEHAPMEFALILPLV